MNRDARNGWRLAGHVGVDSGQLWLGDPCYVKGWRGVEKSDLEWGPEAADGSMVATNKATSTYAEVSEVTYNSGVGEAGDGVAFSSGHGDGLYEVWAHFRNGLVTEVRVRFDDTVPYSDPPWTDGAPEEDEDED